MRIKQLAMAGLIPLMLFSCVSSKKLKGLQSRYDSLNNAYGALQNDLKNCNSKTATLTHDKSDCDARVAALQKQIDFLKENNTQVLKAQPDIEFMVEGHTDNKPFRRGDLLDNWDLSVKRATAVVRVLQDKYGLQPSHIAAARSILQTTGTPLA